MSTSMLIVLYCTAFASAEQSLVIWWSDCRISRCSEWENSELGFSMIVSVGNVGLDHRPLQPALSTRWLHQSSRNYKGDSIIHTRIKLPYLLALFPIFASLARFSPPTKLARPHCRTTPSFYLILSWWEINRVNTERMFETYDLWAVTFR